jgi:hypothetical protein
MTVAGKAMLAGVGNPRKLRQVVTRRQVEVRSGKNRGNT